MTIGLADERPHTPSDQDEWVEAWLFDAVHHDGSLAVSIEYLQWPQHGRVAFHASVIRPGMPLISLVELEAVAPKAPSLEVRAPGLWTDVGIQTAGDHMTVDIEAFAVALDDPDDVFAGAYGDRTALGCELEWETAALGVRHPPLHADAGAYELPCIVHGELLIDELTIDVDGWGWRSHRWGAPRPGDRSRIRGRTTHGEWFTTDDEERELTMQVVGRAPVPEPSLDSRLLQFFARSVAGVAWCRRVEPNRNS